MDIAEQILTAFQVEHKEQIERMRSILCTLEGATARPEDPRWEEVFRVAHTLKGGARVCDLTELEKLGHRMESLFASIRAGTMSFDRGMADTVYKVLDAIEDWMAALAAKETPDSPAEALCAIEALLAAAKRPAPLKVDSTTPQPVTIGADETPKSDTIPVREPKAPARAQPPTESPPKAEPDRDVPSEPRANEATIPNAGGAASDSELVRVRVDDLDAVLRSADELLSQLAGHDRLARELSELHRMLARLVSECETVRSAESAVIRRLVDNPELAPIGRHLDSVIQQARKLSKQEQHIRDIVRGAAWSFGVDAEALRRDVSRTRMISANNVLYGVPTMVRKLSRDLNRDIDLKSSGLDTLADRRVLQLLKDPLMHALRNAVVHGIEPAADRQSASKPARGSISLRIAAVGHSLEVVVEDDGRGIDFDSVRREAQRRNVMTSDAGPDALSRLLFEPGFSTSTDVTELAGRGMGLSVVQTAVARLRGTVELRSQPGAGTSLVIRVPLTISAQRLMLVGVRGQQFAIPTHLIEQLVRVKPDELQTLEGKPMVRLGGAAVKIVDLANWLGLAPTPGMTGHQQMRAVVIRADRQRLAILVDQFVAEREMLIRELDGPASTVRGFAGAVLLDDGNAALVLDAASLTESDTQPRSTGRATPSRNAEPDRPVRVLIVDDSFTTRTLEKSILEANGYDVRVAVDGVEALMCLRSEPIDLVIADIEMPRMDGLTLLRSVKADAQLSHTPLILVTSLDKPEEQQLGLDLGAGAYIVKRKFDHQELLGTIRRFVRGHAA